MQRPKTYHTRQSKAILDYLASLGQRHATASQVAEHFAGSGSPIGIATIYRHLDRLVGEGALRKYTIDGASGTCYQYAGEGPRHPHIHLKCEGCGAVLHLECSVLEGIPDHVYREHSFQINPMRTVLYGKCLKCL